MSIVDNHSFKRLVYEVLDHDPAQKDIIRFFQRFGAELEARCLELKGITTDGSALYPVPISQVFPGVSHQVCQFHVIKELTKAVRHAVAKVRQQLKATVPAVGRGRPTQATRRAVARKKRIEKKITDLFDHRYLFVRHHPTPSERKTTHTITRGLPHLRTLREIMDEVYRLFDRRCRSATALKKLARLRRRVQQFQGVGKTLSKLFSPTLEKSLTFLDDSLLPSTSNAVERGNRRHRKMQKTVYRVRTQANIDCRIALDMQRDDQAASRTHTLNLLHRYRFAYG